MLPSLPEGEGLGVRGSIDNIPKTKQATSITRGLRINLDSTAYFFTFTGAGAAASVTSTSFISEISA